MKLAAFVRASPLVLGLVLVPFLAIPAWTQPADGEEDPVQTMPLPSQVSPPSPGRTAVLPVPLPQQRQPGLALPQQQPGQLAQPPRTGPAGGAQINLPPPGRYGATPIEIP